MISFKEFQNSMEMSMLSFNSKQLSDIYSSICTEGYWTVEEVEAEFADTPEFIVTADKNLSALFDNLSTYQNEEAMLVDFLTNQYGPVIDLFWVAQDEMFVMANGYR